MTDRKYSIWFGRNENFEGSERFLGVFWFMDQIRKTFFHFGVKK
jgi:hypothetical protein